jgi:hypothetical protein
MNYSRGAGRGEEEIYGKHHSRFIADIPSKRSSTSLYESLRYPNKYDKFFTLVTRIYWENLCWTLSILPKNNPTRGSAFSEGRDFRNGSGVNISRSTCK